jgi:prepilin-type N-terminal cleavage/methylation domain-containing protein
MLNRLLPKLNRRGDTIVEVMVVLAVLGLALGIAYSTANRSLLDTRGAEENSQATALLQGQIEDLRSLANSQTQNIFSQGGPFCISPTDTIATASGCKNINTFYNIDITYQNTGTQPDTFTLVASWPDVEGQGTDTVTILCRIHKAQ